MVSVHLAKSSTLGILPAPSLGAAWWEGRGVRVFDSGEGSEYTDQRSDLKSFSCVVANPRGSNRDVVLWSQSQYLSLIDLVMGSHNLRSPV